MKQFRRYLAHEIGVDLGTANTLLYVRGRGILINEPSVVALNQKNKQVIAIGKEAKRMIGRTPSSIEVMRPLVDGVVSDFEITEQMLQYFITKIHKDHFVLWPKPRLVIGIPSGVTEVEKRAVENAGKSAGAGEVFLVEEPMAAAIGTRFDVKSSRGTLVVDIGGGTTEVAVISLGGIVVSRSLRVAGNELTESVMQFMREEFNLFVGEQTAEKIKTKIGVAYPLKKPKKMTVRGRDLITGMPKQVTVSSDQLRLALTRTLRVVVEAIKTTLEETPPELVADIMQHGIVVTGGGAKLTQIDRLIKSETKIKAIIAEYPTLSVVQGAGLILEDLDDYRDILISTTKPRVAKHGRK